MMEGSKKVRKDCLCEAGKEGERAGGGGRRGGKKGEREGGREGGKAPYFHFSKEDETGTQQSGNTSDALSVSSPGL